MVLNLSDEASRAFRTQLFRQALVCAGPADVPKGLNRSGLLAHDVMLNVSASDTRNENKEPRDPHGNGEGGASAFEKCT